MVDVTEACVMSSRGHVASGLVQGDALRLQSFSTRQIVWNSGPTFYVTFHVNFEIHRKEFKFSKNRVFCLDASLEKHWEHRI